jgi:hypothetical protein
LTSVTLIELRRPHAARVPRALSSRVHATWRKGAALTNILPPRISPAHLAQYAEVVAGRLSETDTARHEKGRAEAKPL